MTQFATLRDGGFLLQTIHPSDGNSADLYLEVFDASGQPATEPESGLPQGLTWADALTLNGEIVALSGSTHGVALEEPP